MIVWLASYPRSGNTLLRTMLKQTMGLGSYVDDLGVSELGLTDAAKAEFGDLSLETSWEDFYKKASDSPNVYLVKTHLPPRDEQPVIYVVRDGRQSTASYLNYHIRFHKEHPVSLMALILGDDYYGGWSEHYSNWFPSGGRKSFLLRYEELVNATPEMLQELAMFIGYQGIVSGWTNTFDRLHSENPDFFRVGSPEWQGTSEWSHFINSVFFLLNGKLMDELGYTESGYIESVLESFSPEFSQFVCLAQTILKQKKSLEDECFLRQRVIDDLVLVCEERLEIINRLSK